jgi:hypothetical protein
MGMLFTGRTQAIFEHVQAALELPSSFLHAAKGVTESSELFRMPANPKTDIEASGGEMVQGRQALGQVERLEQGCGQRHHTDA